MDCRSTSNSSRPSRVSSTVEPGYDFAGRIYADLDGQLVMDLNDQDGAERQRFTCAHELIHLAFPNFKKETRYRLDAKSPGQNGRNAEEEYLCDLGAAALLMPRELVADRYSLGGASTTWSD